VIIIGGMIGIGKTTTAKMLHEELKLPVYYENVKDNKVLPLFLYSQPGGQGEIPLSFLAPA
jgi:deoxyadenosine/deoxycytidine kinase